MTVFVRQPPQAVFQQRPDEVQLGTYDRNQCRCHERTLRWCQRRRPRRAASQIARVASNAASAAIRPTIVLWPPFVRAAAVVVVVSGVADAAAGTGDSV